MKFDSLWKAAIGAATILGAIATVYAVLSPSPKEAKLSIYTESSTFNIPPHYSKKIKELRKYESYMNVYEDIESVIPEKLSHADLLLISRHISKVTTNPWDKTYEGGLNGFSGYTYSRIYSSGTKVASKPILDLPQQAITYVRYSDNTSEEFVGEQRIRLKDLYPDDIVYVWSWYPSSLSAEELDQIRLKHSSGVSKPYYPDQVWGEDKKWYAENYKLIQVALFVLGFFTLMFFVIFIVDALVPNKDPESNES